MLITQGIGLLPARSTYDVQRMIQMFQTKFGLLKNAVKRCLQDHGVQVKAIADVLTSLSFDKDENEKIFLQSHVSVLFQAADIPELFGTMNFHWNYLSPPPLDELVNSFDLCKVQRKMKIYMSNLRKFREKTPLRLFCQTLQRRKIMLSPEFTKMVAEFDWPKTVTLEVVEEFRQEYVSHYYLRECAMMLAEAIRGCFIITWFVPSSAAEKLKQKLPREILEKYSTIKLEIAGDCIYRSRKFQVVSITICVVECQMITVPLTEDPCHSINQQWSSQCSISPSHWISCSRVCD